MDSSTKNQKFDQSRVRSDNRRMTGNVNIYICSEAVENKKKTADEDVMQTATSQSSTSLISEKLRQKIGPTDEHLASQNRVRKKLPVNPEKQHNNKNATKNSIDEQLISTTDFNKFPSYESKSNPSAEENILRNINKQSFIEQNVNNNSTRYDRSKLVSCRCPRFDESDMWLEKALKRQNKNSTGNATSYSDKKADQNEQRFVDGPKKSSKPEALDKICTCDRNDKSVSKGIRACEQLCTCCCIDVRKKETINDYESKTIDKKNTNEFKRDTKKESLLGKKDKKTGKHQAELKVSSKDKKESLKNKKSSSSEKVKSIDKSVTKVEKRNDSKKSSKENLPPVKSMSKKDLENVKKAQESSKLSAKQKTIKEKSKSKEEPQEVQSQSKERKKTKKDKAKKSINKKDSHKSDSTDAQNTTKTKKRKEKSAKEVCNDKTPKEGSFFAKLINMMKSSKKVSHGDVKKRGCSSDCTGLTDLKMKESSTKNNNDKNNRTKLSGTILCNGSHYIPNEFHDSKSTSGNAQVNDTVDLNLRAKIENFKTLDDQPAELLPVKIDKATDVIQKFCYDNGYSKMTKKNTENNEERLFTGNKGYCLEKRCSCYYCLSDSEARDQFSFSNFYRHESCCACKPKKAISDFKKDRRRFL